MQATSWFEAKGQCELYGDGSHLAQIDDMTENFCLLEYVNGQEMEGTYYWHSGNDIDSEGVYKQADGEYISWQPIWHAGAPEGSTEENCLGVFLGTYAYSGQWTDGPCTAGLPYICER